MARILSRVAKATMLALLVASAPALAATIEELEALSDASADEQTGIQLAQQQAGQGAWLDALATIERVLLTNPKSDGARLLQVFYMCKIDDKMGAAVAYKELRHKRYEESLLSDLRAQCGIVGGN